MKKLFVILFSIALFTSCSEDDDANGNDKILGTWFIAEANGVPNFELSDCNQESFITFNSDNTTYSEYYVASSASCTLDDETSSEWEKDGEIYSFTLPVDLEGFENVSGKISFNSDLTEFTFTPSLIPSASMVFEKR